MSGRSAARSYPQNLPYLYKERKAPSPHGVLMQCTTRGPTCGKEQADAYQAAEYVCCPIVHSLLIQATRSSLPPFRSPPPPPSPRQ